VPEKTIGPATGSKVLAAALDYIGRGWCPIPVRPRSKKPPEGWPELRITAEAAPQHFNGSGTNLGVHLGPPSHGLTDVDLDLPVAVGVADALLPPSAAVFGRGSKPRSHRMYITRLAETGGKSVHSFDDPITNKRIMELRCGPGAQTVVPPSIHESGEPIEWAGSWEPAEVDGELLLRAVRIAAAAALLAIYWGGSASGRHDRALAVGGVLGRAGWSLEEVGRFVRAVATAGNDDDVPNRIAAARDSAENVETRNVWGLPQLRQQLGRNAAVADRFAEWVGYTEAAAGRFPKFDHVKIVGDGEDTEWTITSGPHTVSMSSDDVYSQLVFGRRWFAVTGQAFHQMKKNAWADFIAKEHARAERRSAEAGSSRQDQFQAVLAAYLDTRRKVDSREDMWRRGVPWDDDAGDPHGFWFPMTHPIEGFRKHLDGERSPFREESGIKLGQRIRAAGGYPRDLSIDGRTRALWFVPRDNIEALRGATIPPIKGVPM
jgi:hypothetical protein